MSVISWMRGRWRAFRLRKSMRDVRKAVKRKERARAERIRVEKEYGHRETIPLGTFITEVARHYKLRAARKI